VEYFSDKIPILGVCLGHQCIGQIFGGEIIHAKAIMHERVSSIHHNDKGVFSSLPQGFDATRYHALVIDAKTLPDCFEVTAWSKDKTGDCDEIIGINHKHLPVEGVQFHPESILTKPVHQLLNNFLNP